MGIKNLVFTGVVTSCCVETTARDAADRGYGCVLVSTKDRSLRQLLLGDADPCRNCRRRLCDRCCGTGVLTNRGPLCYQ
ncbi:MAG: cysteine hydrolase family protein [Pseudomonas sp.]